MSKKVDYLKQDIEQFESMIATLEDKKGRCKNQYDATQNLADKKTLLSQMENFSNEIAELYDKIDKKEFEINQITTSNPTDDSDNKENNPKNQQELKIDESLCSIDFQEAIRILDDLQPQFNKEVYLALFFMDDYKNKKGDLYLQRFLKKFQNSSRDHVRHCKVEYKLDDLENIIIEISRYLDPKENELTIESVTERIAKSLQRNTIFLIEICVDNDLENEIDALVDWFINKFWKPLCDTIEKATKDKKYTNIRVLGFINSTLEFEEEYLKNNLSIDLHNESTCFELDKLLKIPLKDWKQSDIENWLIDHSRIDDEEIETKANGIFKKSRKGIPDRVCEILKTEWRTLIYSTSC